MEIFIEVLILSIFYFVLLPSHKLFLLIGGGIFYKHLIIIMQQGSTGVHSMYMTLPCRAERIEALQYCVDLNNCLHLIMRHLNFKLINVIL